MSSFAIDVDGFEASLLLWIMSSNPPIVDCPSRSFSFLLLVEKEPDAPENKVETSLPDVGFN